MSKQAEYNRKHYENNKAKRLADNKTRKEIVLSHVRALKEESPCIDCKTFYPYYVMHFDHVRGVKEIEISRAIGKGWSVPRIQTEIEKCDLVCCNCHSIRTWQRGQVYGFN